MRVAMIAAAFGAACLVAPAQADPIGPETIVQGDTPSADRGFEYFDGSLGTLEAVRLDITPDFFRWFQIIVPGRADTVSVSWDAGHEQFCSYGACTNLIASGSTNLDLTYSDDLFGGSSYAYISVSFSGSTISAALDPADFVNPPFINSRMFLTHAGPGLGDYDQSLSDIFHIDGEGYARNATGSFGCISSIDGCDYSDFLLTYIYAPGGVPEPATWAMMVMGFGAMGTAMRRRVRVGFA